MNTYFIDHRDERELARLLMQDNLFNEIIAMVPEQFAPRGNARILDLACGPGGWALQVAQAYPQCSVVGVDISERMIAYARAQAEARELAVQFRIMNILRPWDFPDSYFDLVNARFIDGLCPAASLEPLLRECLRVLRPGGVLRITETVHMSAPTSPATERLQEMVHVAMYQAGYSFSPYEMATNVVGARFLKYLGFKRMTLVPYVIDLSADSPVHQPMLENLQMADNLLRPFIAKTQICSLEEFDRLTEAQFREWNERDFCAHWFVCSLVACRANE
jgi:ubiquinone/menaquinone biosynthesis C-methylase UbiE